MQLSWIDPESLRDLAAKLQDPAPSVPPKSQSEPFHSLGAAKAIETDVFGFRLATEPVVQSLLRPVAPAPAPAPVAAAVSAPSTPTPAPPAPAPVAEAAPEAEVHAVAPPSDEQVSRIREQLQIIRAKAVEAGLLQPEPPPLIPPPRETPAAPALVTPTEGVVPLALGPVPRLTPGSEQDAAGEDEFAPIAPVQASPPENPRHFLALEGDLGHRLESYGHWASHRAPSEEMLLVDDHGEVLWGTTTRSDLAFSALLSLNTALRSSADGVCHPPKVIRSQVSETRQLTVLPCGTRHGTVTLAMLNARPVPESTLDLLREALVTAVEGR